MAPGGSASVTELQSFGGTIKNASRRPVADAWVILPEAGRWTASDRDGRFVLRSLPAGRHAVVVRTLGGEELKATVTIPGEPVDLVVPGTPRAPRQRQG
jgi:hypothetical protein